MQPLVCYFYLPPIADELIEDAELIANAKAEGRDLECGQRIEITGRQAAQAAVAKSWFFFCIDNLLRIQSQLAHSLMGRRSETQVEQIVAEVRAEQEFSRKIADNANILL